MFFYTQLRRHVKKQNTKKNIGKKVKTFSCRIFFFQFSLLSVWDLLRLIPLVFWFEIFTRHSLLCVLSCGWDLNLKFIHKICNTFLCINVRTGRKVRFCVWNCLILFLIEYSFVWSEIYRVLSQILWGFLHGILTKSCFEEKISKILCISKAFLFPNSLNLALLSQFYSRSILHWKILKQFTQVLSYVVFT